MSEQATVLLVEDEIFTRRMMQIYFENDGYHVEQAGNANEALALLEHKAVDIVLSDIMMPEISGLELLRRIRKRYSKESLPVIMVTGLDDTKQILQAFELGANDFMTKTKEFRIVLARVALHLDWKRLKQRVAQKAEVGPTDNPEAGAWTWNLKGGEVHFSKRWKTMLGFDEDHDLEAGIDEWLQRIHPEDFDRVSDALGKVQKGTIPSFEEVYRIQGADQSYLLVKTFGVVVFSENRTPLHMAGSMSLIQESQGLANNHRLFADQVEDLSRTLRQGGPINGQMPEDFQNQLQTHSQALLDALSNLLNR